MPGLPPRRDPLHGRDRGPAAPSLFQSPVEEARTFYAASTATSPLTVYTAPSKQKARIKWWTCFYGGADVGPETLTFYVTTPAGANIQIGQAAITHNQTVRIISGADELVLESSYGLRYSITGGATIECVVAGIELRLPS